jgi:hypothetical protein
MAKREWIVELIAQIVSKAPTSQSVQTAEIIVERLIEEGVLKLGYGDADVDMIIHKFAEVFGSTKSSKQDRYAARRLASKYGGKSVCGIIQILASRSEEKFSPVVNNVSQLESKFISVLRFLRKNNEVVDV